jgi:HEPN domain-containing protein
MPPENNLAGSPKYWLRYAQSDLELARTNPPPGVLFETLCFHAQQAAEKALKAVLIHQSILFPKTHSIRILIDLLAQHHSIPDEVEKAAILTDYAVMTRYPGDLEPVSDDEYFESIHLADAVVSWAESIIEFRQ